MKRKQFLATALAAIPALAFSQLSGSTMDKGKAFIVRAGQSRTGRQMKYKGKHPNDIIISKKDTDNNLSIFLFTGYDKVGPSLHLHYHQDEIFYVVEGNYRFVVGEQTMELAPGDTIFLPRNVPHSWLQLTQKGRVLYAVQPAGTLEEFFEEMDSLTKHPSTTESQEIHHRHGMKLVGPGLPL